VVLVLAATAAIIVSGMLAGSEGRLFDVWARIDEPRAFAAGETEALLTARVAVSLFAISARDGGAGASDERAVYAKGASFLRFTAPRGGLKTFVSRRWADALGLLYGAVVFALDRDAFRQDISPFADLMKAQTWWLVLIAAGLGRADGRMPVSRVGLRGAAAVVARNWRGAAASAIMWALARALFHLRHRGDHADRHLSGAGPREDRHAFDADRLSWCLQLVDRSHPGVAPNSSGRDGIASGGS
jgi:hypothetical protein